MCFLQPVTAARLSDRQSVCAGRSYVDWLDSLTLSYSQPLIGWSEGRKNRPPQWHTMRENWTLDSPPPHTHTHRHMHTQNRRHTHISHVLKGFSEAFHNMIAMVISREQHTCADRQMVHLNGYVVTSATHVTTSKNQRWIRFDQAGSLHNPGSPVSHVE